MPDDNSRLNVEPNTSSCVSFTSVGGKNDESTIANANMSNTGP